MSLRKIAAPLLIGACLALGLYTIKTVRGKYRQEPVQTPPEVTSCAKGVRVVNVKVVRVDNDASVYVEVANISTLGIVAVSLETTKDGASYTTTLRGSFKGDKPEIVIKPNQTAIMNMSLVFGDVPLRIGGVFYEDGSEDGCATSLKTLHDVKESEVKKESSNETNHPHPGLNNR